MNDKTLKAKIIANSVKAKRAKKFKFYEIENASSTFQKIISKYRSKKVQVKNKPKNILAFIERAKFKAENLETESEYMMKELRRDIKLDQELVALFGPRAKKHYNEVNTTKFNSKINKYDFFTPKEMKKVKEEKKIMNVSQPGKTLPDLSHIIFKTKKITFSPNNYSNKRSRFFNTFQKDLNGYNSNTISSNTTKFKSFYNTSSNLKRNINKKYNNKSFNKNDNNISNSMEKNKTFPNQRMQNDFYRDIIDNSNSISNNLNLTNYNYNKAGIYMKNLDYLNELTKIKKQFTNKENEFKTYFKNNDYGCSYSKLEYRYLLKKFFN